MQVHVPTELDLVQVEDPGEGIIAYALHRAGEPLALIVQYVGEAPAAWHGFVRYTGDARLATVTGSPFPSPQDAIDAIETSIERYTGKTIAA